MKTVICKPDLDTCLTALVLNINEHDTIECVQDCASPDDLADPSVCCIECGGSGQVDLYNFDHHDPSLSLPPACRQAFDLHHGHTPALVRLVDYVCSVDDPLPESTRIPFPSLSSVFSGMLMTTPGLGEQFRAGVALLKLALDEGYDPFLTMPDRLEWQACIAAKSENARMVAEVCGSDSIQFFITASGLKAGFLSLEKKFAGLIVGPGILYDHGCDIAIVYSPAFGHPPVRKFTIASLNRQVSHLLPHIAHLESNWGGRERIIGSPRNKGSALSENTIMEMVRNYA
jgi:hypothetical protein